MKRVLIALTMGALGLPTLIQAGDLDPPGTPSATMVTLEDLNTGVASAETAAGVAASAAQAAESAASLAAANALAAQASAEAARLAAVAALGGRIDILPDPATGITISQPGSYRLSGNVTATASVEMILISADDVSLDLNGHTVDLAGSTANGIHVTGDRARVFNGSVVNGSGSAAGVSLNGGEDPWVHDLRSHGHVGRGITLGNLTGALIERCVISENGSVGIAIVDGAQRVTVRSCLVKDNAVLGIAADGGTSKHVITDNVVTGSNDGIVLFSMASTSLVTDNFATGNNIGIRDSGTGNLFANNMATGNTTNYFNVSSVTSQAAANEWGDNLTP